jgi:hypothetical protein
MSDPCPNCAKGTFCRTPSCGRLKQRAEEKAETVAPGLKHVYHFYADYQNGGVCVVMDGIARLEGSIETSECYQNVKSLIRKAFGVPEHCNLVIKNLAFLGMSSDSCGAS